MMLSRISLRTVVSQPGRDAGRFLQTIQTEDDKAAEAIARGPGPHFRLDGPRAVHDETGSNQGGYQGLPSIGMLVGEHYHEPPVWLQRSVTRAERTGHAIFIILLGPLSVATKSAGIVYKFAVVGVMVPFGAKGIGEDRLYLCGQSGNRTPQPDIEEIH